MNLHPFQLVMIASITSHLMVAAMFMAVRKMLPTQAAAWWISCSVSIATSYILALLFYGQPPNAIGDSVFYLLNMLSMSGMYIGCREFLGHRVELKVLGRAFATLLSGILSCLLILNVKMAADILFSIYCSYLAFSLSIYLYHDRNGHNRLSRSISALFMSMSLHWLDYPFLRSVEWFAPIGFLIAMVLSIGISLLFSALVLSKFQAKLLESERRAIHEANHDSLTGLCNRSYLEQQFRELARQTQRPEASFSVTYMDLDGFKIINDNHGHMAGDAVLRGVAQRLTCRFGAQHTIARIGGDEFVLLSPDAHPENMQVKDQLIQQLLTAIEQPLGYGQTQLTVSASIGISFFPLHGQSLTMLLEKADTAMYRAKKERRQQQAERRDSNALEQKAEADSLRRSSSTPLTSALLPTVISRQP